MLKHQRIGAGANVRYFVNSLRVGCGAQLCIGQKDVDIINGLTRVIAHSSGNGCSIERKASTDQCDETEYFHYQSHGTTMQNLWGIDKRCDNLAIRENRFDEFELVLEEQDFHVWPGINRKIERMTEFAQMPNLRKGAHGFW